MPFPISRILEDLTATGDAILGPGAPTIMACGAPVSVMGDEVVGAACEGAVLEGSPTVMADGRPVTRTTSSVTGVNPETGAPVSTTVAGPGAPTILVP